MSDNNESLRAWLSLPFAIGALIAAGGLLFGSPTMSQAQDVPPDTTSAATAAPTQTVQVVNPSGLIQPHLTPVALPPDVKLGEDLIPVNITAAEAAHIAIEKSPKLQLARALLRGAHGNTIEARSGLLPNLNLNASRTDVNVIRGDGDGSISTDNAGGSVSSDLNNSGPVSGNPVGLSLTQLLFDFGHTLALTRQAMANEKAAYYGLNRAEQDLVFQTKEAYYLFAQNTGLVAVQDANIKDRQAQLDLAQARLNAGPGEPSDVLTAQTNLADAIQQLVLARSAALSARISLAITMGIDPRTPIAVADSEEAIIDSDFPGLYKQALESRPDLLQSIQQLRAAGYEIHAAKTNNFPVISIDAGYSAMGQDDDFGTNQSVSLGLGLSWAIFDGFNTRGKRIAAQADLETARANLAELQLSIGSDVATAWSGLQYAEQRLPITQSELSNATESLRIAAGRFKAGIGMFLAVTDAEASLVTAQQSVVSANTAVSTAWATMRHAVGDSK